MLPRLARCFARRSRHVDETYLSRLCPVNNVVDTSLYDGGNAVLNHFQQLPIPEELVMVEYIWTDAFGNLRGKMTTIEIDPEVPVTLDMLNAIPQWSYDGRSFRLELLPQMDPIQALATLQDIPEWSFDGSSTGQASGHDSDIIVNPVAVYPDPFRGGRHVIALCESFDGSGEPATGNHRVECVEVFDELEEEEYIFAFEQEYVLYQNGVPLGWPEDFSFPKIPQGPYYCGVGNENVVGRNFVEAHFRACLYAGLAVTGINAEVMLGQWEYQLGPIHAVDCSDQLMVSRYFLHRIGELMGLSVTLHPKPVYEGLWNGSGNHCNVSTRAMREEGGLDLILEAVDKLEASHLDHIEVYGDYNEMRLSGRFETSHISEFSTGVADRTSSIRFAVQLTSLRA